MPQPGPNHPHDRFFRFLFAQPRHARDFLIHTLPADIHSLLDLNHLTISKDSFIDPALREHLSDLLYKAPFADGRPAYFYLLFEHKSLPDEMITFQLLRYMVRIWEQVLAQNEKLGPILPFVLYHGEAEWRVGLSLADLLQTPASLQNYTPNFTYWLYDLSGVSKEDIQGEISLRLGLLLLKYILRRELREELPGLVRLMHEMGRQTGLQSIEAYMRYLARGSKTMSAKQLETIIEEVWVEEEGAYEPDLYDKWFGWLEEGRQKGVEEGRQKGVEEGRQEGERLAALDMLKRLLARRFPQEVAQLPAEVETWDITILNQVFDMAVMAGSWAEFAAGLTTFLSHNNPPPHNESLA